MADTPENLTADGKPLPKGSFIVDTDGYHWHDPTDGKVKMTQKGRAFYTAPTPAAPADPTAAPATGRVENDSFMFDSPVSPEHDLPLGQESLARIGIEVAQLVAVADKILTGQEKRLAAVREQLEGESAASFQSLRDAFEGADSTHIRALKQAHEKALAGKVSGAHAQIVGETEANSTALMLRLEGALVAAQNWLDANPSPVHCLYAQGLGSEARGRYVSQISNSGASALKALAVQAINTKNLHLGAAILDRISGLSKEEQSLLSKQGITKTALSSALLGQAYDAQKKAAETIISLCKRVRMMRQNFSTRGTTSLNNTQKIQQGIEHGEYEKAGIGQRLKAIAAATGPQHRRAE